jgi:hypothetical protein
MAAIASIARISAKRFASRASNARFLATIKFTPSHEYIKVLTFLHSMLSTAFLTHFTSYFDRSMAMLALLVSLITPLVHWAMLSLWICPLSARSSLPVTRLVRLSQ